MKLRVIYKSRLIRKGYNAFVLFPFMFFREPKERVSDELFRHEMEHVYQVMRHGWWKFYIRWLWQYFRVGYDKIDYEIEAYKVQNRPLTTVERYFKER